MAQAMEQVKDHTLYDQAGKAVKLSRMFGTHDRLVVLHNMGKGCPNCALLGDEFNGMLRHLEKVAGFCVVGPDDPKTQAIYLKQRGWQCKLYSAQGTAFIRDLGFEDERARPNPASRFSRRRMGPSGWSSR